MVVTISTMVKVGIPSPVLINAALAALGTDGTGRGAHRLCHGPTGEIKSIFESLKEGQGAVCILNADTNGDLYYIVVVVSRTQLIESKLISGTPYGLGTLNPKEAAKYLIATIGNYTHATYCNESLQCYKSFSILPET